MTTQCATNDPLGSPVPHRDANAQLALLGKITYREND